VDVSRTGGDARKSDKIMEGTNTVLVITRDQRTMVPVRPKLQLKKSSYFDVVLLGNNAMMTCRQISVFRRNILQPYSRH
jgi:hypothetical protein